MGDETIIQVKIRRKDIYDAVRNLLLNEFKIVPADLIKAVEKKIEERIAAAMESVIQRYGFSQRVEKVANETIEKSRREIEKTVREKLADEVKSIVGEKIVEHWVNRMLNKE